MKSAPHLIKLKKRHKVKKQDKKLPKQKKKKLMLIEPGNTTLVLL